MATHVTCDGIRRRDFLKAGALGGIAGLQLGGYLRMLEAGEISNARATSAIFINLAGGPSHVDTFDLKPDAPSEFRGEFNPIQTNVPGIEICEHLPKLAQCADKFAILRGVTHTLAAHELGSEYVNTGNRPLPSLEYPGYGSVAAKELPGPADLPPFVAIPNTIQKGGFLGVKYAPLSTGATPKLGQPFRVRGISLGGGLTLEEVDKRQKLLGDLDTALAGLEKSDQLLGGLDTFSEQAYAMITSRRAREAFDTSREPAEFAATYGETPFGTSCLLATRLVEAGVRFVTISSGGWDTHRDNWNRLKGTLLPPVDAGLSALLCGLEARGLLERTIVFVTGEFGRTPKINTERGGRDHYPRSMFMLLAGGGVRGGQVVGASDATGSAPAGDGFSPDDVAATFYTALGIDPTKEYATNTGRPVMIARNGRVLSQVFG